jgi:hypothetical protein
MEKNRIFNLIIFGEEFSGKSTLLNLISKKENLFNVNNNNNKNKNKDFISKKVKLNNNEINFNFIETIGINSQFKINNINNKIINFKENFLNKNYKIVLITIDVTNENNFDAFEKIMNVFSFYNSKENLFIVFTKGNLIKNDEKREEKYLNILNDLKKISKNFSINFNNVFYADDENINNLINKIISTSKDKNSDLCYISIKNENLIKNLFISKENNFIEENEENFLIILIKKLINENNFYNNPNLLL